MQEPCVQDGRAGLVVTLAATEYSALFRCVCGTRVTLRAAYFDGQSLCTSAPGDARPVRCPACGQQYTLTLLARPYREGTP